MAAPFDPSPYVRAPIITVSSGATLALALEEACPKKAPANVKKAARYLKTVAEKARADLAERNRKLGEYSEEDSRVLDNEADRIWGGLNKCLEGTSMLPQHRFPKAKRAGELLAALFPEGMEFLKAEYAAQSTKMASILEQIDGDKLAHDIDDIAGADFLVAVRDLQPRYEQMINERLRRDKATGQNLAETVRSLQGAIVNYASKVVGTVEHDDPATAEVARVALLPIPNFRNAAAARGQARPPAAPPTETSPEGNPQGADPT